MIDSSVLVLNQNYEPLNIARVRRAVVLVMRGKAEMLENGTGVIRTATEIIPAPSVIRLAYLVKRPRQQKKLSKKMSLGAGKMWAKVSKKRGTDFQVTTPTSVASVKGTSFGLEEKPFPETVLWVLQDQVELSNGIQTIIVNQGQKAVSTADSIIVGNIGNAGCDLVEMGEHKIRLQFEDSSGNSRDLVIEFEK